MATRTITTYEHTCDLCGEIREKDDLTALYDSQGMPQIGRSAIQADICTSCQDRPVSEVLAFMREQRESREERRLRVQVRQA